MLKPIVTYLLLLRSGDPALLLFGLCLLGSLKGGPLDDVEELFELDLAAAVLIHLVHDMLDLLAVAAEAEGDERFLQFLDSDAPCNQLLK
jgi:hypothetical protein